MTSEVQVTKADGAVNIYKTCLSMVEFFSSNRCEFNNDLDQMVVYIVLTLDELRVGGGDGARPARGVNAMSISQITRIPRESVRRKLACLERANIARRGEDGLWRSVAAPRDIRLSAEIDRHFRSVIVQ